MCGLVGIVTKGQGGFTKEQVDIFDNLLYLDALRGMDSTGVFLVNRDGEMNLAKEASAAHDFRKDKEYKSLLNQAYQRGRAMIGHNRAATKGTIIDENAHPFVVDDRITLCHNGTLWGDHRKLANVDVDSHAIAHVIHDNGDDVEKALQQVNGAFALIWHDFKNNTLNFIRNTQRPLHFVEVPSGWIWASEANMLEWIITRHGLKPIKPVALLEEGVLTKFDFSNNTWKVDSHKITLTTPVTTYTGYPSGKSHPYANGYFGEDDNDAYVLPQPTCDYTARQDSTNNVRHLGHTPAQTFNQAIVSSRVSSAEMHIAISAKINYPVASFMKDAPNYAQDTYQTGTCIDHIYVAADGPQFGYYLYAQMDNNPGMLIKYFMPADTPEMQLLDMCLNNKRCLFRLTTRAWRTYTDASKGTGFALFNSDSCKEMITTEET